MPARSSQTAARIAVVSALEFSLIEVPISRSPEDVCIQGFRGDFADVTELIQTSWAKNDKQALLYTQTFLKSCFDYPGSSFSFAPTVYDGGKPIAFIAGFPRRVRFKSADLQILLVSLLTVAHEHKKKGYGVILWAELVKRAREAGFDGMINYCVEGDGMDGMMLGCGRMLKLSTQRIFAVHYQMRLLQPGSTNETEESNSETETLQTFMESSTLVDAPLTRIWSEAEAAWQCSRESAIVAHHASGPRRGVLTGYLMQSADAKHTKCLLIEDILWGSLEKLEREALVGQLLKQGQAAGAQIALVPCLNYADMDPFRASRFRTSSSRVLQAYLTIFSNAPAPEPVPSMYVDVF
jgi:GNAT superfamily N-acetyltransferase